MTQKILLVDDEPGIALALQFLLQRNRFTVMVVHNGEEALTALDLFEPDLILLEVTLPGLDGFQVCQTLKANPCHRNRKVVFISAMTRDMDIAKANTLGADAYITKPFSNSEVVRQIKDLLEG